MSDEKSQQQTSTESTVAGAAKTGKAISNIAKGAAAGGAHGAAIEAGKSSAKWLIPLIAAVLLPLILVAMLPSIIFGSLLGDGTDSPNGISNDEVLVQNMTAINEGISSILSEGLTDVLERIDSDFASSGCDGKEINNPFGADVVFNANAFVSQYCAHKDTDIASISKEDRDAQDQTRIALEVEEVVYDPKDNKLFLYTTSETCYAVSKVVRANADSIIEELVMKGYSDLTQFESEQDE